MRNKAKQRGKKGTRSETKRNKGDRRKTKENEGGTKGEQIGNKWYTQPCRHQTQFKN